jgi:KUP system potassium uptake protein
MSIGFGLLFFIVEGAFLLSNLNKIAHGGWFTFLIAAVLFTSMYVLYHARKIRDKHIKYVKLNDYISLIHDLQLDKSVPKEANNLVYMAMADNEKKIDENIIYSLFRKRPKRADVYWFLHIEVLNEPFDAYYSVDTLIPKRCFFVKLYFGFKIEHKVNLLFKQIIQDMIRNKEVDEFSHYESLKKHQLPADFKYILLKSIVSADSALKRSDQMVFRLYRFLKFISVPAYEEFGLELSNVEIEKVPIQIVRSKKLELRRVTEK